jgi:tRNA A37 threonylcarbamoyladenosine dehydratase
MGFADRTRILVGDEGLDRLARATVAVYGLGGVGAACAMDLVRVGVGRVIALDFDEVRDSNLNRLYFGYLDTVGTNKAEAFAAFARRVNPECAVEARHSFMSGATAAASVVEACDFHLDCIDSLAPKISLIAELVRRGLPLAACTGTAGRLDPSRLRAGSLWDSSGCPLARETRNRLRRLGVDGPILAVWSDEPPVPPLPPDPEEATDLPGRPRATQGSAPFVPQAAGHLMASLATRFLLGVDLRARPDPALRSGKSGASISASS